jgi:predicted HicB family RNase H-like nuclease
MEKGKAKPNVSIRIDKEILYQAKVAAVSNKMTLGDWLEEAVNEKIKRDDTIQGVK